jgi:3-mercaptopyruvate sulfurtransferase SseA
MKWKSITHDGSTVDGLEYVTVSLRLMNTEGEGEQELGPDHKVPVQQLSLGAVLTDGKTAEEEVAAIEARMLERFSGHLDEWRKKCEEMYPDHDHPHIPESQGLAWHRLADGGSVMT